ncbi:MAG: hypothetical protein ACYSX0_09090 [Planctomycetota bacterium]|jgi:hypothetical protein
MRLLPFVALVLAACSGRPVEEPVPVVVPEPAPAAPLPEAFVVTGQPEVREAYLGPEKAWRQTVSLLSVLRAEAVAGSQDILVTFEETAVHATTREGSRRTWLLPDGLTLLDTPAHLLLGGDLTTVPYGSDGAQMPMGEEVTVVRARIREADGENQEFRLIIKGGSTFRSISNAG